MYGWLWRTLPGNLAARLLQVLALLAVAVLVLFVWVFPWVEGRLPYSDVTVPGPGVTGTPSPGTASLPAG